MNENKLKWLCRRGMKELDLLLMDYLAHDYLNSDAHTQSAFIALLHYSDPQILDLLFGRTTDDDAAIQLIINTLQTRQSERLRLG